ncbi:PREDICTED: homeobox protein 10-like [Camelina sativa]|uniref:Homeobox protein 10-like n=1 Tax=Camelina sativa TaxID=90675 RepID=A0ABM0WPR8_CAMSA|nr:PREDICTED: homeobox protein 10-like [Camelina sativa]
MESQEQSFFNPTNQNVASKPETEDPISRLSSSSSSSCSSIEAEPRPDQNLNNNNNVDQSPPIQVMERSTNNTTTTTTTTSSPTTPPYRIPSHVFARTTSTAPVEWITMSNESLFSIHMGNNSFTGGDYFKSGELTFPQPPSPISPPLTSPSPPPPQNTNQGGAGRGGGGGVVAEAKTPMDIGKKAAETDKAYRASKEDEQKAAASIREVIMANEAANNNNNNNNNNKTNKLDRSVSRRSEDFSLKSFAFPVLGNADKGGLQGSTPQNKQRKPSLPETPKISNDAAGGDEGFKKEEVPKSVASKAEADRATNHKPKWLSCFPCCTTFCV